MSAQAHRSRIQASAATFGGADIEHRFMKRSVLLTGEAKALLTENGAEIIRCALQLLMRICPTVKIALPPLTGALATDLAADGARFTWDKPPIFVSGTADFSGYDAILSIGGSVLPDLPWTAISSSGWLVRVSSTATGVSDDCTRYNPIGALAAASLGVCEVFKRFIDLDPELGDYLDGLEFSLWDYCIDGDLGPDLPNELPCKLVVNGAGAIGSALVHGLARLPLVGNVVIVDRQRYAEENWGTCLDLEPAQMGEPKADIAAMRLRHGPTVDAFESTIAKVRDEKLGKEASWPTVVLNGLDDVDARHDSQRFWPAAIIDGALDSDLQVRVSAHVWESEVACLICTYQHPAGEDPKILAERHTGLSPDSLAVWDRLLTDDDIARAAPEKQETLRLHKGKRICSIVPEMIAQALSSGKTEPGFAPSVPFAASFSASLELTEFVRYTTTGTVGIQPLFQMSLLVGPFTAQRLNDVRHDGCECRTQGQFIKQWRERRGEA